MKKLLILLIALTGCSNAASSYYYIIDNTTMQINCIEGVQYWMSSYGVATLLVDKNNKPLTCPWSKQ